MCHSGRLDHWRIGAERGTGRRDRPVLSGSMTGSARSPARWISLPATGWI